MTSTAVQILKAMSESKTLTEEVLRYLDHGMLDEWDIGLVDGIKEGFGEEELQIAARSGLALAAYHEKGKS